MDQLSKWLQSEPPKIQEGNHQVEREKLQHHSRDRLNIPKRYRRPSQHRDIVLVSKQEWRSENA